jgi:Beta-ketoacyl synthase, N-terminal domain
MSARIAGIGCVTPLGCEVDDIWRRITAGERAELIEIANTETGARHPAAPIPPGALAKLAPLHREQRLRRASPISLFAAAAGRAALADSGLAFSPEMRSRLALVFGVSSGGVQYTRRFYEQVVKQGANVASPMLFPETVYNAPASHLAAMLGVDSATYTLVGDGTVGLQALQLGMQLIELGNADHVLVVAAEELDWILLEAHHAWHLTARDARGGGAVLSEGAAAVLLSPGGRTRVETPDGVSFRHHQEASQAMRDALRAFAGRPAPDIVLDGSNGTWADAHIAAALADTFPSPRQPAPFANQSLGESLGSSALMQVVLATHAVSRCGHARALVAALGWNQQAAAAWLERVE